jgi:hypothetical protein
MQKEVFELNGAVFQLWTYQPDDRFEDTFHSFVLPDVEWTQYTFAQWAEGEYFNEYEGVAFRGIRTNQYPALDTVEVVKQQIRQKAMDRGIISSSSQ